MCWLFTAKSSRKTSEVEREQRVNVSFSNHEKQHYVSVSGTAGCVDDRESEETVDVALSRVVPQGSERP